MSGQGITTRVCAYIRVSTEDQARHGHSLEAQRAAIAAHATARGWAVAHWYEDAGASAYTDDAQARPAFAALVADVAARRWDTCIVLKIDRFARSIIVASQQLRHFIDHGCALISIAEAWDFSTASGLLLYQIMAVFAEHESRQTAERVRRGMAVRAAKGLWQGTVPWAARLVDGRLMLDPGKGEALAWVLDEVTRASFATVAAALNRRGERTARGNLWRPYSVQQWLRCGAWLLDQPDPWPARYHAARERLRMPAVKRSFAVYMLTGLLRCACGGRLVVGGIWRAKSGELRQSMRCQHWTADRPSGAGCPHRLTTRQVYEAQATAWVRSLAAAAAERPTAAPASSGDASLRRERDELAARRARLNLAFVEGGMLEGDYRRGLAAVAAAEASLPRGGAQREAVGAIIATIQATWGELPAEAQNRVLRLLTTGGTVTAHHLAMHPSPDLAVLLA